jgi:hypothetical protein
MGWRGVCRPPVSGSSIGPTLLAGMLALQILIHQDRLRAALVRQFPTHLRLAGLRKSTALF